MVIYVLQLDDNKFYIGKTKDVKRRYEEHVQGLGSAWTTIYRPVNIIEVIRDVGFSELSTTLRYMKKYGIENVRGAEYCSINLTKQQISEIKSHIRAENDQCYFCGGDHFIVDCDDNVRSWKQWTIDIFRKAFCCRKKIDYLLENDHLDDTPTIKFGKYRGQSYLVAAADKRYCNWILKQNSTSKHFNDFQKWLKRR